MVRRRAALTSGLVALAFAGCGGGGTAASPESTINDFLNAAAAGDGPTACALLSASAQQQVVQGAGCEQGIKMAAPVYGSIIKQIKIADVKTAGSTASGVATLNGKPTATFQMTKSNGKWVIDSEQRAGSTATSGSTQSGPTQARLTAISQCLAKAGATSDNAGSETTGGAPHQVLAVNVDQLTVAMLDVFGSSAAASSAYTAIRSSSAPAQAKLIGDSVVVYLRPLAAAKQAAIATCG
jgi:hypothetical protein